MRNMNKRFHPCIEGNKLCFEICQQFIFTFSKLQCNYLWTSCKKSQQCHTKKITWNETPGSGSESWFVKAAVLTHLKLFPQIIPWQQLCSVCGIWLCMWILQCEYCKTFKIIPDSSVSPNGHVNFSKLSNP